MINNYLQQNINIESLLKTDPHLVMKKLPEPLKSARCVFTAYGRNAIYFGLKEISVITKKRTVLVPSYSCGDEIKAIISAGFKIRIYDVKKDLSIDSKEFENCIKNDVAAVLFIHYFGFPFKGVEALKILSKKHKFYLIEDCAHSLGGKYKRNYLGLIGDISVFSLRKFYPIPHGGALIINNPKIRTPKPTKISEAAVEKDLAVFFGFRTGFFQPGILYDKQIKNDNISQNGSRLSEYGGYELGISNTALKILVLNPKSEAKTRRNNFNYYLNFFLKYDESRPLFKNISNNINPLCFPIIVNNSEKIYKKLCQSNEIFVQPFWSYLHKYINWNRYKEARELKQSILILPVHRRIKNKLLMKLLRYI